MTVRLLNAAVMPRPGVYRLKILEPAAFAERVRDAHGDGTLVSYIGYPACKELLEALTGVPIALNRSSTPVEAGDVLLIARLIYRVDNPAAKGQVRATLADYEFFACEYE